MKPFNGYQARQASTGKEILPAGAYVARIIGVKTEETQQHKAMLAIAFDIAEGQQQGFFQSDFDQNPMENKKWRGVYRLFIPTDDGSERDDWSKRTFENAMWAVEDSNEGYTWNWQEESLKGKLVGVVFRNKEWEYNNKTGWITECGALTSVQLVRQGKVKPLKDRPLDNSQTSGGAVAFAGYQEVEDILPF